jgi:hypothetical protein
MNREVQYLQRVYTEDQQYGGIHMKRNVEKIPLLVLGLVLLVSMVVSACGSGGGGSEGESLLQDRCTVCHTLSRVKTAGKSMDEWTRTVDRMIAMGANLDSEERGVLLDYLEATYSN